MSTSVLRCRLCEATYPLAPLTTCAVCSEPLDVEYEWNGGVAASAIASGPASMWRYEALLPHSAHDPELPGATPLVRAHRLSEALGIELHLKLEGANPTHSFKDRIAASAVAA